MTGSELISAERERQVTEEGWTAEHDAGHASQLIAAGTSYADSIGLMLNDPNFDPTDHDLVAPPAWWPWAEEFWKPTGNPVRDLVKAGALIAAAIDSLQAPSDSEQS